jgi:SAM-dependent methyltransferase
VIAKGSPAAPYYYQHGAALVHARAFGKHGDRCAPGILELLAPVRGGLVLELGCGSGALTRHLLAAGHQVIATDASPDMLALARAELGPDVDLRRLTLPDDRLPAADAIVSVGHVISYLPDAAAIDRGLAAMADALAPGGVLAIDICDLEFGEFRAGDDNIGRAGPDWAIITRFSRPTPDKFIRDITTFVPDGQGAWRRDDERHENVLIDTSRVPALLRDHGVTATLGSAFDAAELPTGLRAVTGIKS